MEARGVQNVARHNTELSGERKELDWRPCEPSKVCSLNEHSISFIATSLPLFFSHSSVLEKIFLDLRESNSFDLDRTLIELCFTKIYF